MTIIDEINNFIKTSPENYGQFYVDKEDIIDKYVSNFQGIKSDVYIRDINKELNNIRFAAIFSDLINIYPGTTKESDGIEIIIPRQGERQVTIPYQILQDFIYKNGQPVIHPGYLVQTKENLALFLKTLEPLLEKELAIVHNSKTLLGLTQAEEDGTPRHWTMYDIAPTNSTGNWLVMENSEITKSLPINFTPSDFSEKKELLEITIPYLRGIDLNELTKVLNDNYNLLSSFRVNLKQLIAQAKADNKNIEELKNDVIRPQVDKLSWEFKKIQEIHKLKVFGTTFTTITLGLLAYSTSGISQIISTFLGTGGLGLAIKNEVDFKQEILKLSNHPLYLMWELKKLSK
jgi:hypothetical protein